MATIDELFPVKNQQQASPTIDELFPVKQEPSMYDNAVGALENIRSIGGGMIAEPIAGLAGLAASAIPGGKTGAEMVEAVRSGAQDMLAPTTQAGIAQQQAIGEALQPVGEAISGAEKYLGNKTLEATGSPFLASIAHTLPTAALELVGVKGSKSARLPKQASKGQVNKALKEAAPSSEDLKSYATRIYDEIDNSGATIKSESLQRLSGDIRKKLVSNGMDPRTTPVSSGVLSAIDESSLINQPISELDKLRKIANAAAKSVDPTEKSLGAIVIDTVENFMDNIKGSDMVKGSESLADTGKKYRAARNLYGRAKRSEDIVDAITQGADARSGAENGIRNELNKILRSKKRSKFYSPDEIAAIRDVVQGDFKTNLAKMIGRVGFMEGSSTSVLGSLGGIFAGGSLLGPIGAVSVPAAGVVARKVAQKLTSGKANLIDETIRAGGDGRRIAKAYLDSVPKSKRSIDDLSSLLSDPNVKISELEGVSNKFIKDALDAAKGKRQIDLAIGAFTGAAQSQLREEDETEN